MGLNNIEVKRVNRNNLLMYMLKTGQFSKRGAATALRLSIPTVTQCLNDLIEMGLAKEEGAMDSSGGRKSVGYCCIKDAKVAVGVDITRNHVNMVILDLAMNVLHSCRVAVKLHDTEESYAGLKKLIWDFIYKSEVSIESILGLGVSISGIVGENGDEIIAMNEEMEISFRLYDIMKEWFPFPIHMENDADSAGRAEIKIRGFVKNAIYFFVSPSVGGAIVINGKSIYGRTRRAGEFGHMTLYPGGVQCYCGRRGCVDAYCSTDLLSEITDGNLGAYFDLLDAGDRECMAVWEKYLDALSLALHNLLAAFDMEIILGGYLGQYITPYMNMIEKRLKKMDPYLKDISFIRPAILKYEASAIGVASYFTDSFLANI